MPNDTDAPNLGRQARDDTRRKIAELAIAGLQKPFYASVFRPLRAANDPTWVSTILLDGYQRRVEIAFSSRIARDRSGGWRYRYRGRISGLKPLLGRRDFDLAPEMDAAGDWMRLSGYIDLEIARLSVTVIPCRSAAGDRLHICLLEVSRREIGDGR